MASYQPGDLVHVAGFGKGMVREVRNNGRYLVEIKGRAMEVGASQLSPVDAKHARRVPTTLGELSSKDSGRGGSSAFANASADKSDPPREFSRTAPAAEGGVFTLDLHGHTVESALEALDACLNDALLAGASEIHVIHGKSGGRIRRAIHERLTALSPQYRFALNADNMGITVIAL